MWTNNARTAALAVINIANAFTDDWRTLLWWTALVLFISIFYTLSSPARKCEDFTQWCCPSVRLSVTRNAYKNMVFSQTKQFRAIWSILTTDRNTTWAFQKSYFGLLGWHERQQTSSRAPQQTSVKNFNFREIYASGGGITRGAHKRAILIKQKACPVAYPTFLSMGTSLSRPEKPTARMGS